MQVSGSKPVPRGLVVDDDASLCEYMTALLRPLGVEADSALDGREAEQRLRGTNYDVLFLDLRLPIVSGEMILQLVNKGMFQRPGAIVLMSAYTGGPSPEQMTSLGVAGFLSKPFAPADVRASVEYALASRPAETPAPAPLSRRAFRRAPLASAVIVHAGENLVGGFATDLSEGGLGMTRLTDRPVAHEGMSIEFALPGEEGLVLAGSELAWVKEAGDGLRAGLRFKNLMPRDRERIRRFVESSPSAD